MEIVTEILTELRLKQYYKDKKEETKKYYKITKEELINFCIKFSKVVGREL